MDAFQESFGAAAEQQLFQDSWGFAAWGSYPDDLRGDTPVGPECPRRWGRRRRGRAVPSSCPRFRLRGGTAFAACRGAGARSSAFPVAFWHTGGRGVAHGERTPPLGAVAMGAITGGATSRGRGLPPVPLPQVALGHPSPQAAKRRGPRGPRSATRARRHSGTATSAPPEGGGGASAVCPFGDSTARIRFGSGDPRRWCAECGHTHHRARGMPHLGLLPQADVSEGASIHGQCRERLWAAGTGPAPLGREFGIPRVCYGSTAPSAGGVRRHGFLAVGPPRAA